MNLRTDLAIEISPKSTTQKQLDHGVIAYSLTIDNIEDSVAINKPLGDYITIEAKQALNRDIDVQKYTSTVITQYLKELIDKTVTLKPDDTVLLVGLGNPDMSSDALGSKTLGKIIVTRHVYDIVAKELDTRLSKVCAVSPNVLGVTGIETFDIVKGVADSISPKLIIVVDSLASLKTDRIACTYQMTNTGVTPGGGIGNFRKELSIKTLGVPVIAVGVPLVVYASTIVKEFVDIQSTNLSNKFSDLVVTPKDIDLIVSDCAYILSNALNLSLHRKLTLDDVISYTH